MPIPIYGCTAHGGKILSLDDEAVVKDLANEDGTGGNAYAPFAVSTEFDAGNDGGYSRFRKAVQSVSHDGAVTVKLTPYRDGQLTGQTITRTLAAGANPIVTAPFASGGTRFQVKVELSGFDAKAELGEAQLWIVPRRSER